MINLLLVDRENHVYQGMLTELHNDPEIGLISPCESADQAASESQQTSYDAILINAATVPHREALQLTRKVAQRRPAVQVLVFGLATAKEVVLEFIEAGADAYVRGTQSVRAVVRAMRAMLRGEAVLCPDIAAALMKRIARLARHGQGGPSVHHGPAALSPRQQEILELLQRGKNNQEIAAMLYIEVGTVKNHVHNVLAKMNVKSRREAAARAPRFPHFDAGARMGA
jgi:DNA-binding NarL/FixJ family response regulator